MATTDFQAIDRIVRSYIFAKDNNKPHLMKKAFADFARLEFVLKTDRIWFPSEAVGLDAMTDILVRKFGQTYENVYTFCVSDSVERVGDEMSCHWLVAMTEREGGTVRVGCGKYDWHFVESGKTVADRLQITIEAMVELKPDLAGQILGWVSALPYPWCDHKALFDSMPDIDALQALREKIG